ncbi:EthD family reductase [Prauserella cavernicola]|uniref:EthD family reductase n=1 Tax=Prauserella cavernicola TaxID=2800127 RepID=A0A934QN75_9PSEU|nr:EthD family reductase [Prauserella cavernicola]MBK1782972.1 EthD family reductase [Prauserella cavernicola]
MYRLTVLYPPPTDPEHFREYYVNTHLPLAATLPGLRAMRYSLDVSAPGGQSPYFAVFEGDFDSYDAMVAALSSEQGQAVNADVPNYATGGVHMIHYAPVQS